MNDVVEVLVQWQTGQVALYACVSTKDKEPEPEAQLWLLREHAASLDGAV